MIFSVTVERDEDGVWIAKCPAIPGCVSQGSAKYKAIENIRDAIKICLAVRVKKALPPMIETHYVEVTE